MYVEASGNKPHKIIMNYQMYKIFTKEMDQYLILKQSPIRNELYYNDVIICCDTVNNTIFEVQ